MGSLNDRCNMEYDVPLSFHEMSINKQFFKKLAEKRVERWAWINTTTANLTHFVL